MVGCDCSRRSLRGAHLFLLFLLDSCVGLVSLSSFDLAGGAPYRVADDRQKVVPDSAVCSSRVNRLCRTAGTPGSDYRRSGWSCLHSCAGLLSCPGMDCRDSHSVIDMGGKKEAPGLASTGCIIGPLASPHALCCLQSAN